MAPQPTIASLTEEKAILQQQLTDQRNNVAYYQQQSEAAYRVLAGYKESDAATSARRIQYAWAISLFMAVAIISAMGAYAFYITH